MDRTQGGVVVYVVDFEEPPGPGETDYPLYVSLRRKAEPPKDHVNGDWWHIDLIGHLNLLHHRVQGRLGHMPFCHTLACPMELADREHKECHAAGQSHE